MARKINRKAAELLKRVAKYLVREPEGYSQSDWKQSAANSCGTVCCIAGTVVMLDNPKQYMRLDSLDIQSAALKALGLDEELSINLFSRATHWPSPFSERSVAENFGLLRFYEMHTKGRSPQSENGLD